METAAPSLIAVRPATALTARPRLFSALEAAFPVRFAAFEAGGAVPDAVLAFATDPAAAGAVDEGVATGLPTLVVGDDAAAEGPDEPVVLEEREAVDQRLHGVTVLDRLLPRTLAARTSDEVLAHAASGPVWTRVGAVERVRAVLPELEPDEVLFGLVWRRACATVALLQLVRSLGRRARWEPAPLRAAFVFDDPNLRWKSYGFINYQTLLEHADTYNYHASMAMIPLDAGRPHRPTAELFARRRDRLSLNVHGNDHVKRELLRPRTQTDAFAVAGQALRRVERFERLWGLPVDRVMMPPHGMCSGEIAHALGAVGFDALCAIHPRPWTGEPPTGPALAAWHPAEFAHGCPVIPRLPLDSERVAIALRAFLDHPIVLYAHHEDMADGLAPLAAAAEHVNALGDVRWSPVGEIALTNVEQRLTGDHLDVRAFARRVRVTPPAGTRTISVAEPAAAGALAGWSLNGATMQDFGSALAVPTGAAGLELRLHGSDDVDPESLPAPAWRPWPQLRRLATEARDRVLPLRAALSR